MVGRFGWSGRLHHTGPVYAICSNKSPRRSPFTLKTEPLLVESASTSSATRSWFRREVAARHLGNGDRERERRRRTPTVALQIEGCIVGCVRPPCADASRHLRSGPV